MLMLRRGRQRRSGRRNGSKEVSSSAHGHSVSLFAFFCELCVSRCELFLCFPAYPPIRRSLPPRLFRQFLRGHEVSYYGGPELPEAVNALRLPTISMGSTGEFGIWIS